MAERSVLVWFRNDLRIHDNEMLAEAISKSDKVLPVYFFDPRHFVATQYQTLKTGPLRTRFLIESVAALRKSFQQYGGDLLILSGKPEELLPGLVEQYGITEVYHHREVAPEETAISSLTEDALWKVKINLKHFIGHTLYNKEDLPFPIKDIPDNFARFKKKTEREAIVKSCIPLPEAINFIEAADYGQLPDLKDFGMEAAEDPERPVGGEEHSLKALQLLIDGVKADLSMVKLKKIYSGLSAWLALGCLSPRQVYWEIKNADGPAGFNQVLLGLLWRDYYRFMFKKHGNHFFTFGGFAPKLPYKVLKNDKTLMQWKRGQTGVAAVDHVMSQLNRTGNISNEGRNLVALYLIQVIKLDWTLGAAYFEEQLLDYAPATNWGSWATLAGVGNEQPPKATTDFSLQLKNFEHLDAAIFAA